jgi:hypothetical protein
MGDADPCKVLGHAPRQQQRFACGFMLVARLIQFVGVKNLAEVVEDDAHAHERRVNGYAEALKFGEQAPLRLRPPTRHAEAASVAHQALEEVRGLVLGLRGSWWALLRWAFGVLDDAIMRP